MTYSISLDAMGGDFGPPVVVPAAIAALQKFSDIELVLVGDQQEITHQLESVGRKQDPRCRIHHTTQVVTMDEPPAQALRGKKDSSMRVAINLVKSGAVDAMVSAGNTGALMATAKFVLHTLAGIDRPAINTTIPSINGHTHMLDLGANVDCKSEHLLQFGVMGSVLAAAVDDNPAPKVGLLNVGQEAIKGNDQVKGANKLLQNSALNYIGYVEGDDIYCGDVDVVVCDGFVGNVALKTSEGVARLVTHFMREGFKRNILTQCAGLLARSVLKEFKNKIDPRLYNGASLLGLQGIVIKSHGGADAFAFEQAIAIARLEAQKQVPQKIDEQLQHYLNDA